jgi:hypothetical protein
MVHTNITSDNYSNINPSYPPLVSFIKDQMGYTLTKSKENKKKFTKKLK